MRGVLNWLVFPRPSARSIERSLFRARPPRLWIREGPRARAWETSSAFARGRGRAMRRAHRGAGGSALPRPLASTTRRALPRDSNGQIARVASRRPRPRPLLRRKSARRRLSRRDGAPARRGVPRERREARLRREARPLEDRGRVRRRVVPHAARRQHAVARGHRDARDEPRHRDNEGSTGGRPPSPAQREAHMRGRDGVQQRRLGRRQKARDRRVQRPDVQHGRGRAPRRDARPQLSGAFYTKVFHPSPGFNV